MDTKCKNKHTKKAVSNVQPTFELKPLNISTTDSLLLLLNETERNIRKTTCDPPASFWQNISVSTDETRLWKSFKELSDIVQMTCCIGIISFFSFLAVVSPNLLLGVFTCTGILITLNNGMKIFCRLRETDADCKVRVIQADLIKSMNLMVEEKAIAQIEHGLQLHSEILREIVDKERLRAEVDAVKLMNQEEIASLEATCFQIMTTQLGEDKVRHMFSE